ncbi:conserved exported hypothetical protein [Candidatus Accumulibacter aalborgensis]|uniref:Uncharacterized protein n=1 Tax=Candidatus Accumulibacter aalborgensis TaxID=1860102 RepID=A0A1A8XSS7_9PROT|nr:hypothetical protein [Candidatus Accumulibacter aalborgensis]SBT07567.1 conserved exported hypothetical protein [Candidatus Accumulibacter aalborgensis]
MIFSRRQFIRTGLAGGALLSFSGWLNAAGARALSAAEREMLAAVCSAMLDGALPRDNEQRRRWLALTVDGIAGEVAGLSLATQKEVGELFGLLVVAPGRLVLAGVSKPWREASVVDVSEFLQSWRSSRIGLLQGAYGALHDLIFGAWYARSDTWEAIGYPGPPQGFF